MAMGELWIKHGATDARLSSLNGSDMGCLANTITFENAEAFGEASDAINTDPEAGTKYPPAILALTIVLAALYFFGYFRLRSRL